MRTRLAVCIVVLVMCCSAAYGRTLTFDEFPSGTELRSSSYARVSFSWDFLATDHMESSWGSPHSGSNVLTTVLNPYGHSPSIVFGRMTWADLDLDHVQSVGAYFSTDMNARVTVTAYRHVSGTFVPVTSVVIGAPGESWNNRYVEITYPQSSFEMLDFEGVNSPDDLLGFCADDMNITYVPEPSSLLALGAGLLPLAVGVRRRCRRS